MTEKKYNEMRDRIITEVMNTVKVIYKDDRDLISGVQHLTVCLELAQFNKQSVEFVKDLWGFMLWATQTKQITRRVS
jgi:hypothetical protein